VVNGKGGSKK
jgi:hypothetical protein